MMFSQKKDPDNVVLVRVKTAASKYFSSRLLPAAVSVREAVQEFRTNPIDDSEARNVASELAAEMAGGDFHYLSRTPNEQFKPLDPVQALATVVQQEEQRTSQGIEPLKTVTITIQAYGKVG